jgi:hypothetical protein
LALSYSSLEIGRHSSRGGTGAAIADELQNETVAHKAAARIALVKHFALLLFKVDRDLARYPANPSSSWINSTNGHSSIYFCNCWRRNGNTACATESGPSANGQ